MASLPAGVIGLSSTAQGSGLLWLMRLRSIDTMTHEEFLAKPGRRTMVQEIGRYEHPNGWQIEVRALLEADFKRWTMVQGVRQRHLCCHCGSAIEHGEWCYRPAIRGGYAHRRLCIPCVWLAKKGDDEAVYGGVFDAAADS